MYVYFFSPCCKKQKLGASQDFLHLRAKQLCMSPNSGFLQGSLAAHLYQFTNYISNK